MAIMDMLSAELLFFIAVLGGVAGFAAGLLGIGGGIILVPGLYYIFRTLGYESDMLMHLCVGTSLAIIVPTGLSSARAHYMKGNVRTDLVKTIGFGIVLGVIAGTLIADRVSGETLKLVFSIALFGLAGLMMIPPERWQHKGDGPSRFKSVLAGTGIGTLSTLMGIGGATMNVPFMTLNGVSIHRAVGSASAMGPLIALPACIGFMMIGQGESGMPPFTFGFVNFLAIALIAPISVLCAIPGAKAAHALPTKKLRLVFIGLMILIAVKMIYGVIAG